MGMPGFYMSWDPGSGPPNPSPQPKKLKFLKYECITFKMSAFILLGKINGYAFENIYLNN